MRLVMLIELRRAEERPRPTSDEHAGQDPDAGGHGHGREQRLVGVVQREPHHPDPDRHAHQDADHGADDGVTKDRLLGVKLGLVAVVGRVRNQRRTRRRVPLRGAS